MVREMSILVSMRHPNIVAVHEVVIDSSQMFLVMELVDFDLGLLIEHMKQPFSEAQVRARAPTRAPEKDPFGFARVHAPMRRHTTMHVHR